MAGEASQATAGRAYQAAIVNPNLKPGNLVFQTWDDYGSNGLYVYKDRSGNIYVRKIKAQGALTSFLEVVHMSDREFEWINFGK
jgi:hypothetical protein